MKRKIYVQLSIIFLILSITLAVYGIMLTGIFDKNKILVRALTCDTCASYEVIVGENKLSTPLFDTVQHKDLSEVFLSGTPNPFAGDYTKTYDYYLITGSVTSIKQTNPAEPWHPVLTVGAWDHFFFADAWPFVVGVILLFGLSIHFYRRFINANRISVLKTSLMTHEELPD